VADIFHVALFFIILHENMPQFCYELRPVRVYALVSNQPRH